MILVFVTLGLIMCQKPILKFLDMIYSKLYYILVHSMFQAVFSLPALNWIELPLINFQ